MRSLFIGPVALLALLVACSSSDNTPAGSSSSSSSGSSGSSSSGSSSSGVTNALLTLGGTFDKLKLTPTDGIGVIDHDISENAKAAGVKSTFRAFVSDRGNLCGLGSNRQNGTVFFIEALSDKDTIQPGEFTQHQDAVPGQVDLGITKLDGTCQLQGQDYGTESGKVTITSVTSTAVSGTFDVTLMNGAGTLTGSFNVPICAGIGSDSCAP
jgi:hypothetical protein